MSKQRVHELAKEFGKTNKDVMDFLKSSINILSLVTAGIKKNLVLDNRSLYK